LLLIFNWKTNVNNQMIKKIKQKISFCFEIKWEMYFFFLSFFLTHYLFINQIKIKYSCVCFALLFLLLLLHHLNLLLFFIYY
jgi:hypothetical protein